MRSNALMRKLGLGHSARGSDRPSIHESTPLLAGAGRPAHGGRFDGLGRTAEEEDDDEVGLMKVYELVHRIRIDLLTLIDTPLSFEQLTSPAITFSITRPLERAYFDLKHPAIIFALLVNRVQFITDSTHTLTLHSVNATRASLCEILATHLLRKVHESDLLQDCGRRTKSPYLTREEEDICLLKSSNIVATAFSLFEGAPQDVLESLSFDWGQSDSKKILARQSNALEMAIVGEAKQFIRSPACQRVIDAIWTGQVVYTSSSIVDILSDRYKHRPVSLYNPRNAPLLNHYRLTVPRNRTALEYFHYFVLVVSYILTLQTREMNHMNWIEIWFNVFTLGFAVDKLGSILEHGWLVFIANLWNGFDAAFILGHLVYLGLRITGLIYLKHYQLKSHWLNQQSHQVLSCLAISIFPRLAFITLSNNLLILSLRSMLSDFLFLMVLGSWCFLGFLYSLYSLQKGDDGLVNYSLGEIAQWMVYIFFGLDSTGLAKAHEFHQVLGPAIFIIYACLSNTLLVTVMVSILSKIFSDISNDAIAETLYRKAVLTFEGVKCDAIFSFQPPFNIPALIILITLKPLLTPRKFHTVVVFMCRFLGCPVLLTISFFERYLVGPFDNDFSLKMSVVNSLGGLAGGPKNPARRRNKVSTMSSRISRNLKKFGGLDVINACFDYGADGILNPAHGTMTDQEDRLLMIRKIEDKKKQKQEGAVPQDQNSTIRGGRGLKVQTTGVFPGPCGTRGRSHSQPGERPHIKGPSALEKLFSPPTNLITSLLMPSSVTKPLKPKSSKLEPPAAKSGSSISMISSFSSSSSSSTETTPKKTKANQSYINLSVKKPASIIQDEAGLSRTVSSSSRDPLRRSLSGDDEERLVEVIEKAVSKDSIDELIQKVNRLETLLNTIAEKI